MSTFKLIIYLLFLLLFPIHSFSQTPRIDSLKLLLDQNIFSDENQSLEILNQLFDEFYYLEDSTHALKYANILREKSKQLNNITYLRQGKLNSSLALLKEKPDKSIESIQQLLEEAIEADDDLIEGLCYLHLGIYDYKILSKEDGRYFKKAQKKLQQVESLKEVLAIVYLAICSKEEKGYQVGLNMIQEAYSRVSRSNNLILTLEVLRAQLFFEYQLGKNQEASQTTNQFIEISNRNNYYTAGLIHAYSIAIDLLVISKNIKEAQKYAEQSYQIGKKINNLNAKLRSANRLALLYIDFFPEKYDQAEDMLIQSLALAKEHSLFRRHFTGLYFYGILHEKKNEKEKAIEKYLESLTILETSPYKNKRFGLRIKAKIASLSELLPEDYEISLKDEFIYNESLDSLSLYSKMIFNRIKKEEALRVKNSQEAFDWYKKEVDILLQIKEEEQKINIKELILEKQLQEKYEDNIKNQEILAKTRVINYLLIFGIIAILSFIAWMFNANKKKQKLSEKILEQNKEIKNLNNSLKEKNELLLKRNKNKDKELMDFAAFKAKHDSNLQKIKEDFEKLTKKESLNLVDFKLIKSKIGDLQSKEEANWISFKEKIEESYPNFFSKLTVKHTNLSENDKFHCGYILIGLSAESVADIRFVSKTTVYATRYRIKKKLGLEKAKKLKDYFAELMI